MVLKGQGSVGMDACREMNEGRSDKEKNKID